MYCGSEQTTENAGSYQDATGLITDTKLLRDKFESIDERTFYSYSCDVQTKKLLERDTDIDIEPSIMTVRENRGAISLPFLSHLFYY